MVRCIHEGLGRHPKVTFQKTHFLPPLCARHCVSCPIFSHFITAPRQVTFLYLLSLSPPVLVSS